MYVDVYHSLPSLQIYLSSFLAVVYAFIQIHIAYLMYNFCIALSEKEIYISCWEPSWLEVLRGYKQKFLERMFSLQLAAEVGTSIGLYFVLFGLGMWDRVMGRDTPRTSLSSP